LRVNNKLFPETELIITGQKVTTECVNYAVLKDFRYYWAD